MLRQISRCGVCHGKLVPAKDGGYISDTYKDPIGNIITAHKKCVLYRNSHRSLDNTIGDRFNLEREGLSRPEDEANMYQDLL